MNQSSRCSLHSFDYHHNQHHSQHDDANKHFKFEPALYVQRYDYLSHILKEYACLTYLDIGCSECRLLGFLKNTNSHLNLIIGIDIDQELLQTAHEKLWADYIRQRDHPLEVYLIKGDISNPSDYFIEQTCSESTGLDCVSLVEVIEHMEPETVVKCMDTVFNKLRPKIVVVSTPNNEFNIVFEALNHNITHSAGEKFKFRHDDHKFEWNRKEFQEWCVVLLDKYSDYEIIRLDGLGFAPENLSQVGACSQIAVFRKKHLGEETREVNKFQKYLQKKVQLGFLNRQQVEQGKEKLSIVPYFSSDEFKEESSSSEQRYELVDYIQYPHE